MHACIYVCMMDNFTKTETCKLNFSLVYKATFGNILQINVKSTLNYVKVGLRENPWKMGSSSKRKRSKGLFSAEKHQ